MDPTTTAAVRAAAQAVKALADAVLTGRVYTIRDSRTGRTLLRVDPPRDRTEADRG